MFRQIIAIFTLSLLGLSVSDKALAQTTPTLYHDTDTIYQTGLTANSTVQVELGNTSITKNAYSDACGVIKLSLGDQFPADLKVNNTLISSTTPTISTGYKCVGGTAQYSGNTPTTSYQTSNISGKSIKLYIVPASITGGANRASLVTYSAPAKKTVKVNSCGVLAIKGSARNPLTAASILTIGDGSPIAFGNLPTGTAPICQKGETYTANSAAANYNGASLYRTDKAIYQIGMTPNSLSVVQFDALSSKTYSQYRDNGMTCGMFVMKFKDPVVSLKIGATTYPIASVLTTTTGFDCPTAAGLSAFQPDTLYKSSPTLFYYRTTDLAKTRLSVEFPSAIAKNVPVNACGFVSIDSPNKASGFSATDVVKINGTQYILSGIPVSPKPPICKGGVLYQAAQVTSQ
jgi:hypothetical protein